MKRGTDAGAMAWLQIQDDATQALIGRMDATMVITSRFFIPFGHLPHVQSLFLYIKGV